MQQLQSGLDGCQITNAYFPFYFIQLLDINFNHMDINDFKHNFKYKLFLPLVYIINWSLMFIGPSLIQVQYQKICLIAITYLCLKSTLMVTIAMIAAYKSFMLFGRAEKLKEDLPIENALQKQILHAFIIPSYKEDIDLLSDTLDHLAAHPWAKARILIFLAMEAHEEHSDVKAEQLIKKYDGQFRMMGYTHHILREFQQKGKASNVSWCAEHLEESFFRPCGINLDSVFLTIIDADSWVPPIYIKEMEDHMTKEENYDRRHKFIYCTNQIYTRNFLDVPIITRTYDQLHSCMHHSNMLSLFDACYPLSNYSLSYNLAKKIGFWDTCADAIGEDFHTTLKAYWKCQGDIESYPIYAAFNQVNIQTGKGYFADMEARFWQAERHARGAADVAYSFNQMVQKPFSFRAFLLVYQICEAYILPGVVPWAVVAMNYESNILWKYTRPSPELISQDYINIFFTYATVCFYATYFFYFLVKRRANTVLYNQENESLLRIIEYPILFLVNMAFITVPCMVLGSFGVLFEGREYVVAEKVINKKLMEGQEMH